MSNQTEIHNYSPTYRDKQLSQVSSITVVFSDNPETDGKSRNGYFDFVNGCKIGSEKVGVAAPIVDEFYNNKNGTFRSISRIEVHCFKQEAPHFDSADAYDLSGTIRAFLGSGADIVVKCPGTNVRRPSTKTQPQEKPAALIAA